MLAIDGLDMSYEIGRCQLCDFHFAARLPSAAQYGAYYKAASKYDVASSVSALDRLRIDAAIEFMNHWIPKDHQIVDLGCGYGALLAAMRHAGWSQVQGIDPAPQSAQRAREIFGLDGIHCSTLNSASSCVDLQRVDLVCLMAVLEHLPALREDLEQLLAQLRPGVRLLIEVPTVEGFYTEGAEPFGEFSIEHIQFFSSASLHNLFSDLGLCIIAERLQDLPLVASGSVFMLAEAVPSGTSRVPLVPEPRQLFDAYLHSCQRIFQGVLERVPQGPFIIYGAGSHSARLVPRLPAAVRANIVGIVDGNPNLHGKLFGDWTVLTPDWIASKPSLPVLVSSYRSQNDIAANLRGRYSNPLVLLY
jgi:SAM-dependent methyltransferase